jgi:hypothetical protein
VTMLGGVTRHARERAGDVVEEGRGLGGVAGGLYDENDDGEPGEELPGEVTAVAVGSASHLRVLLCEGVPRSALNDTRHGRKWPCTHSAFTMHNQNSQCTYNALRLAV